MLITIHDIPIYFVTYNKIIEKIFSDETYTVAGVNQDYFNIAYSNPIHLENIKSFDLIFPDGIGMQLAAFFLMKWKRCPERITGSDLFYKILYELNRREGKLFLVGGHRKIAKKAAENIIKQYSNIKIVGIKDGYEDIKNKFLIQEIISTNPDFIFVGLGGVLQEKWVMENRTALRNRKIIAVGGGLRVIAKERKRGFLWVQKLGFEWVIRLFNEPKSYWKRYIIGIPKFIYFIFKEKYN